MWSHNTTFLRKRNTSLENSNSKRSLGPHPVKLRFQAGPKQISCLIAFHETLGTFGKQVLICPDSSRPSWSQTVVGLARNSQRGSPSEKDNLIISYLESQQIKSYQIHQHLVTDLRPPSSSEYLPFSSTSKCSRFRPISNSRITFPSIELEVNKSRSNGCSGWLALLPLLCSTKLFHLSEFTDIGMLEETR